MRLLTARRDGNDFVYAVHLDEAATIDDPAWQRPLVPDPDWKRPTILEEDDDGNVTEVPDANATAPLVPDVSVPAPQVPDPAFVLAATWGLDPRGKVKAVDFDAQCRRELALLCRDALARLRPSKPTPANRPGPTILHGEGDAFGG